MNKETTPQQLVPLFNGLGKGVFRPSDLDGIAIIKNTLIILEIKHRDAKMPFGQQLTLTRMVDSWQATGRKAMVLLARHKVGDTEQTIEMEDLIVTETYYKKKWVPTNKKLTQILNKLKNE